MTKQRDYIVMTEKDPEHSIPACFASDRWTRGRRLWTDLLFIVIGNLLHNKNMTSVCISVIRCLTVNH